jgi:hypothetical protein
MPDGGRAELSWKASTSGRARRDRSNMHQPSASQPHDPYQAQLARLDERIATAWNEYLAMTRAGTPGAYGQTEAFAWRRLRRDLAHITLERRRVDFEHDRQLAEDRGSRRAA